jgi:hypothetical protein
MIYSTEPIWATAFAAMALEEKIGFNTVVGAMLIVVSIILSCISPTFVFEKMCYSSCKQFEDRVIESSIVALYV